MNKKLIVGVFAALLLASGCSNEEDEPKKDTPTEEEVSQKSEETESQGLDRQQNQEMIDQLLTEEGVEDANVYEVNDKAVATIRLTDEATEETANALAEKYAEQLATTYTDKKVNTIVSKRDKVVADIVKDDQAEEGQEEPTTVAAQALVDEGIVTIQENPVTKQLSFLIDSTKLTGELKRKDASDLRLIVENEVYVFNVNKFNPNQFLVLNTDYTEEQLKAAQIQLK